jgi:hypothetical protein
MTRGRFQNDAAVTFAVMSHKTILSFLVHFSPIFQGGNEMQYTCPSASNFKNGSHLGLPEAD